MNINILRKYWPYAKEWILEGIVDNWSRLCDKYGIDSPREQAHLLAQIAHESANLRTTVEYGTYNYFKKYNNRKSLGNTEPGDGPRYRGRGLIQITGRANYSEMSKELGVDLINNPELLEKFPLALETAFIFWYNRDKLKEFSLKNDIIKVTKIVNGGTNGLSDRRKQLHKAREVFNVDLSI